ncbi:site-specific integrase [Paraburkholderia domus]|uniref:site-specific integrase n=1 Tax=Paraburkholderia domus TaxID=2793075 RepID=UPI0019118C1F|nr:site-specific integrase [Paraburkholderia domus]MBK5065640.1 tyrosine-type recombinase/integrase [Burkholderia sp. R-70199]CAE6961363.1 Tyrosine recombinase XerC [Paraburkholderia domus]
MSHRKSLPEPIARLEAHLREQKYSAEACKRSLCVAQRFFTYMQQHQVDIEQTRPVHVTAYLDYQLRRFLRYNGRYPKNLAAWRNWHRSGVQTLLRVVQGRWPPVAKPASPREAFHQQLCESFLSSLVMMRDLARGTLSVRQRVAQHFLESLGERGTEALLAKLTLTDVDRYVQSRASQLGRGALKNLVNALRSFLRYLHQHGWIALDLAPSLISPRLYTDESIPSAIRIREVEVLLKAAREDRSPKGLRDYAIVLMLCTYGLRASEVARLRLEELDWRRECVRIRHTKTRSESMLPLLQPVGEAILEYLRNGRPQTAAREIFVRAVAPYRAIQGYAVYHIVVDRLHDAGVSVSGKQGPHALRHACAVSLLGAESSLKTIADVLGHRSLSSSKQYLKLSMDELREVALEVPTGSKS